MSLDEQKQKLESLQKKYEDVKLEKGNSYDPSVIRSAMDLALFHEKLSDIVKSREIAEKALNDCVLQIDLISDEEQLKVQPIWEELRGHHDRWVE